LRFGWRIWCPGALHGTPVGAGYSGTSANEAAGAQSRAAGVYAAATVLALVLLFLPWIERIPEPVLAAIVIHAVSKSLRWAVFRPYFRWQRDRLVTLTAVAAVLLFGMLDGLLAAIAFSLAMLLHSLSSPRLSVLGRMGAHDFVSVTRFPEAACTPGILVLRPEEPLFFANAEPLLALARRRVLQQTDVRLVMVSLEESPGSGRHRTGKPGRLRGLARQAQDPRARCAIEGDRPRRIAACQLQPAAGRGTGLCERR
jgi:SulP family sulfate permease